MPPLAKFWNSPTGAMESSALAGTAADRRATPSTTADAPPWLAAVVDAAAVCKRGLAANQVLDIKQPDLHVVLTVLLAASVDVAEDMRQLYAVCDVLLDAGWLTLPEPAVFAESDLQQRLGVRTFRKDGRHMWRLRQASTESAGLVRADEEANRSMWKDSSVVH